VTSSSPSLARIPREPVSNNFLPTVTQSINTHDESSINALFEAAADSVEESIYNVLTSAESMEGPLGRKGEALPLDSFRRLMDQDSVPVRYVG